MAPPGSRTVRNRRSIVPVVLLIASMIAGCVPPGTSRSSGSRSDSTRGGTSDDLIVRGSRLLSVDRQAVAPILRVAGPGIDAEPTGMGVDAFTLEVDFIADAPPTLALELVHCDRNWQPTRSVFVQDRAKLRTSDVAIFFPPFGAVGYDFTATVTFPGETNRIEVERSGNYMARLVDAFDNRVVAEVPFFAVESTAGISLELISDFFESAWTEKAQEGLRARVEVTPPIDLFSFGFEEIHLIESGKWRQPIVASDDESRKQRERGEPRVLFNAGLANTIVAEFLNLPSGNEHRVLDLTDVTLYPPGEAVVSTRLSDEPRRAGFGLRDNDGMARYEFVPPEDRDYVYFEFRLDIEGERVFDDMAVVGTFNNWKPTYEWRLDFDEGSRRYVARGWINRAIHEYEYVSGSWDVDSGILRKAEATLLEGNSVYASMRYYALSYYRDQSASGYDRIVGVASNVSGGR